MTTTAMKLALETVYETIIEWDEGGGKRSRRELARRIVALTEQPAQPQQEPAAVWELFEGGWDSIADPEWMKTLPVGTKLYTSPPAQQEPIVALELLSRCENEMRYAGWDKFESDNTARNGVYEQVKRFLEKNT